MRRPAMGLAHWQAALLRGIVLVGGLFALGGALTLFAIGLLANGRGIGALNFSWTMFAFSVVAGLAQGWLALLGCQSAWRWIAVRRGGDGPPAETQADCMAFAGRAVPDGQPAPGHPHHPDSARPGSD